MSRYRISAGPLPLAVCLLTMVGGCTEENDKTATAPAGGSSGAAPAETTEGEAPATCCLPPNESVARSSRVAPEARNDAPLTPPAIDPAKPSEPIQLPDDAHMASTIVGYKPDLDAEFVNEDGKEVNLAKDYPGKTLVITTIYTACPNPAMCPRLGQDFARLAKEVPAELRDQIRFVMISFDPQRDTPEVMKAWGRTQGVDFEVTDLIRSETIEPTKKIVVDELQIDVSVDPLTNLITNHAMIVQIVNKDGYIVVERAVKDVAQMDLIGKEMVRAATMPFTPPAKDG